MSGKNSLLEKDTGTCPEERRSRRAYSDPTADMAIANVMREERRKKKQREQREQDKKWQGSPSHGGVRHDGK